MKLLISECSCIKLYTLALIFFAYVIIFSCPKSSSTTHHHSVLITAPCWLHLYTEGGSSLISHAQTEAGLDWYTDVYILYSHISKGFSTLVHWTIFIIPNVMNVISETLQAFLPNLCCLFFCFVCEAFGQVQPLPREIKTSLRNPACLAVIVLVLYLCLGSAVYQYYKITKRSAIQEKYRIVFK